MTSSTKCWCPRGPAKRGPYAGLWFCYLATTRSMAWTRIVSALGESHASLYRQGWRVVRVEVRAAPLDTEEGRDDG